MVGENGAIIGASAGFTNGFVTGFGNNLIKGENFGNSFINGIGTGIQQGTVGFYTGGILGGISAVKHGRDFWTGETEKYFTSEGMNSVRSIETIKEKYKSGSSFYKKGEIPKGVENMSKRINNEIGMDNRLGVPDYRNILVPNNHSVKIISVSNLFKNTTITCTFLKNDKIIRSLLINNSGKYNVNFIGSGTIKIIMNGVPDYNLMVPFSTSVKFIGW